MAPRLKVTQTAAGGRQTITSLYSCLLPRLEHSCHFPLLIITIMNIRCLRLSRRGGGAVAHPLQLQHSHLVHQVLPPLLQLLHLCILIQVLRQCKRLSAAALGPHTVISTPVPGEAAPWPSPSSALHVTRIASRHKRALECASTVCAARLTRYHVPAPVLEHEAAAAAGTT